MSRPIWKPSKERLIRSNMFAYMNLVNGRFGRNFKTYDELYRWSVENIPDLWASLWDFLEIEYSKKYEDLLINGNKMPGAKWFTGAKLNFAENLLRFRDGHLAIIAKSESGEIRHITYTELYDSVAKLSKAMRETGIKPHDRVAGFMPNIPETVIAMMASASIGALWTSCSPDFGIKGVLDRFGQIKPKILFTADGYFYNGKKFNSLEKAADVIKELPSVEKVVIVPYSEKKPGIGGIKNALLYDDFIAAPARFEIEFEQLPFEHPLYIMYSSGTTGLPKCMVQSTGGILINHLKELKLHTDVKRDDRIFYYTTCGWMMWNWLVSSLSLGATVMLYDGSPFYPDAGSLFKFAQDEKMTVFGTSAKYIAAIEKEGLHPAEKFDLRSLKTILSTGSPLAPESFDFVYKHIKKDVCLSSISGGTDLNGCFALGNPLLPVYRGELQCRGLGMSVEAFDEKGASVIGKKGELVCTAPFPSMPLYFWNDESGKKYHKAYFDVYPNVWRHGDFIIITKNGGVIMLGRSDATLNPGGVRIGTSEIYRLVETFPEIKDSVIVGQRWKNDERVILFVKMAEGFKLTGELIERLKKTIRAGTTPRHVPAKIIAVADIPYTINMKKVELAVKNIIHGEQVLNKDALANPSALDLYKDIKELEEE